MMKAGVAEGRPTTVYTLLDGAFVESTRLAGCSSTHVIRLPLESAW